jgi:hypothetical protein
VTPLRRLRGRKLATTPAMRASSASRSPSNPGSAYVLDWENPADWTVPAHPPAGWSYEYLRDPNQIHHDNGEPPVRVASAAAGEPVRAGAHSVRFELDYRDGLVNNGPRAEIGAEDPVEPRGVERWYGFSTYLPTKWTVDYAPEIIVQWHQSGGDCSAGCSPPLSLITKKGQYEISQNWQNNASVPGKWTFASTPIGAYQTGRWTDWVVHVKWSTGNNGLLQVWKDGSPVPGFENKIGRNDDFGDQIHGNYILLGIYKWPWRGNRATDSKNRVLYTDELRITDGSGSYAVVAPPQTPGPGHGPARLALYHSLQVTPGEAGEPTTATFSVVNDGGSSGTIPYFLVGARTSSGGNVDFPASAPITLQPGQSYAYQASRSLPVGNYSAWPAYYDGTTWTELGEHSRFAV